MEIKLFRADEILCLANDDDEGNLGAGSYGKVRLGFHEKFGAIAVKCSEMKGGAREKNLLEKKIKKQIGHLQQANHENIVRVYGWTQWSGAIAIIMEYLPAGNLKAVLLDEDVVLGPLLRARFGAEIANGLAFIHNLFDDKRLLHGDIKPENILMTEDLHCKIGDFGAAQLSSYTGSTTSTSYRDLNSIQLTKLYSAPERLRSIGTRLTPKHDTYSYGMTLHMILTREPLLDASVPPETFIEKIIEGQRPSLESIEEQIREQEETFPDGDADVLRFLKEEMISCWQQDPADRPFMMKIKNDLYSILGNYSIQAVHEQVGEALRNVDVRLSSLDREKYVFVSEFRPPDFDLNDFSETYQRIARSVQHVEPNGNSTAEFGSLTSSPHFPPGPSNLTSEHVLMSLIPTTQNNASIEVTPSASAKEEKEPTEGVSFEMLEPSTTGPHEQPNPSDSTPADDKSNSSTTSSHYVFTVDEVKADVKTSLDYLSRCGLLETVWSTEVVNNAKLKLKQLSTYTSLCYSKLFRQEIADEVLHQNAISLFLQHLKILINDGYVYPKDSVKCLFLDHFKRIIWNLSDASDAFCVESCKSGLIALMAVHFRYIQGVTWLTTKTKENASRSCLGILYNCSRRLWCLKHTQILSIANIPSQFRKEMVTKMTRERMEFLTFFALLLAYLAEDHQMHLFAVHQSLINYIVEAINKGLHGNQHIEFDSGIVFSINEICDGLLQLSRNKENARTILNASESIKCVTSMLNSVTENKSSLKLLYHLCLPKENREQINKATKIMDFLRKSQKQDHDKNLKEISSKIYQLISATEIVSSKSKDERREVTLQRVLSTKEVNDEKAKSDVRNCLQYLKNCGLLDNEWNEDLVEVPQKQIMKIKTYTTSNYSKEFQLELVNDMLRQDVVSLFVQYFKILIDEGNEYPIDSVRYGFLEILKGLLGNLTKASARFCCEIGKQGLIALMAVHLLHLQGLFWLPTEVKEHAEHRTVGILYNCARRQESSKSTNKLNLFELFFKFRCEMSREVKPERKEFLTFIAFCMTYMVEEQQLPFLGVHPSLIEYIVSVLSRGIQNNKRIRLKRGSYSLSEICDDLAQLAYNEENASAVLKCPDSFQHFMRILKSENEPNRKAAMDLVYNLCLLKKNRDKIRKQVDVIDILKSIRIKDPAQLLRLKADEIYESLTFQHKGKRT
ncbi:uncharacterized protein LOC143451280 isoform X2 [Clavelina lepadiformis]|uniref:uncharacterized protein LOC143451280 isoform X2 n=1 Tax=Clavelina lepadiformis TaxID=159417 RepID=UPI0040432A43